MTVRGAAHSWAQNVDGSVGALLAQLDVAGPLAASSLRVAADHSPGAVLVQAAWPGGTYALTLRTRVQVDPRRTRLAVALRQSGRSGCAKIELRLVLAAALFKRPPQIGGVAQPMIVLNGAEEPGVAASAASTPGDDNDARDAPSTAAEAAAGRPGEERSTSAAGAGRLRFGAREGVRKDVGAPVAAEAIQRSGTDKLAGCLKAAGAAEPGRGGGGAGGDGAITAVASVSAGAGAIGHDVSASVGRNGGGVERCGGASPRGTPSPGATLPPHFPRHFRR